MVRLRSRRTFVYTKRNQNPHVMKKLMIILVMAAAPVAGAWSATGGELSTDTYKNKPILDSAMERLFEEGRLGEVVDTPKETSVDTLINRLMMEKSTPEVPRNERRAKRPRTKGCHGR